MGGISGVVGWMVGVEVGVGFCCKVGCLFDVGVGLIGIVGWLVLMSVGSVVG